MKKLLFLLTVLASCNSPYFKMAEDFIEGEAEVIEKMTEDAAGIPNTKPTINLIPARKNCYLELF
jgi:hypothetical protein